MIYTGKKPEDTSLFSPKVLKIAQINADGKNIPIKSSFKTLRVYSEATQMVSHTSKHFLNYAEIWHKPVEKGKRYYSTMATSKDKPEKPNLKKRYSRRHKVEPFEKFILCHSSNLEISSNFQQTKILLRLNKDIY